MGISDKSWRVSSWNSTSCGSSKEVHRGHCDSKEKCSKNIVNIVVCVEFKFYSMCDEVFL